MEQIEQPANDNSARAGDSVPKAGRRLKKNLSLDADNFLIQWRSHLSSKKDPLPALRSMCKAGINGDASDAVLQDIISALAGRAGIAERLALHLAFQLQFGKPNSFTRRLLRQLRTSFETSISYDASEFAGYRGESSIEGWVIQNAPKESSEFELWLRRSVVVFLEIADSTVRFTGLLAILRELSRRGKKLSKPERTFVQGIIAALASARLKPGRILNFYSGIQMIELERRDILDRERHLQMTIRGSQDTIHSHEQKIASLQAELAAANNASALNDSTMAARDLEIQSLKEQLRLVDRHWEGVSEQQLAKQGGALRGKVQHELQEALLALDRENPNIEMALNRLRRIEGIVKE